MNVVKPIAAIVLGAGLVLTSAALAQTTTKGASTNAPGQKQTTPGTAKNYAPGQKQTTPGTAKTYAPGQKMPKKK